MCQITPNPVLVKFIMVTKVQMTFLVFQEQDDNDCDNDNDADFDNEGYKSSMSFDQGERSTVWRNNEAFSGQQPARKRESSPDAGFRSPQSKVVYVNDVEKFACPQCERTFLSIYSMRDHFRTSHENMTYDCVCGKSYKSRNGLWLHRKTCVMHQYDKAGGH
ncbi:zinc finger protein 672-like isoform X5 [Haliotis rubra]|uniref:zinc finger protein 672-like isoform X5 n=1 Tax=Haliotis rubra TaxID=36100 RepID=UPI001EE53963|nr:zinc finger protein 672-like isoform X5 [Haliotis rubra]